MSKYCFVKEMAFRNEKIEEGGVGEEGGESVHFALIESESDERDVEEKLFEVGDGNVVWKRG